MVTQWINLPRPLLVGGPAEPYLVNEVRLSELRDFVTAAGATWVTVDIASVDGTGAVIDALKSRLPFPDWCASSWDSMEDAFEEIRQSWSFPLVVTVQGLRSTLEKRPHVGLEVVLRLSELCHAFSVAGDQLTVVYVDLWP
ncbi:barstar family protein [Cryobacterium algoricola]